MDEFVIVIVDLPFIFCGPSGDVEVYEDTNPKLIEHLLAICKICNEKLRIIKRETICHVCNKPLTRNGYKSDYINNTNELVYKNIIIEIVITVVVWLQQNLLKKKIVRILNQYKKRAY